MRPRNIDRKSWNARLSTRSGQVSVVRMMSGIAVVDEILLRSDNLLVMS
jgi:hypothetical protein